MQHRAGRQAACLLLRRLLANDAVFRKVERHGKGGEIVGKERVYGLPVIRLLMRIRGEVVTTGRAMRG